MLSPPSKRLAARGAAVVLLLATLHPHDAHAQLPGMPDVRGAAQSPAAPTVPDPGALTVDWWSFVTAEGSDTATQAGLLLGSAGAAASRLPPENATAAGQALERLRIGLSALPGTLAATPTPPDPAPAPAQTYTARELLKIDRDGRELRREIEERAGALAVAERALAEVRRQLDRDFAAYLARRDEGPERVLQGLAIMATRVEVALAEAERKLRLAELELARARLGEFAALSERGIALLTPDPERSPERIGELIAENGQKLELQREKLLRVRAERSSLAVTPGASRAQIELADLRLTSAIVEENVIATRIALLETERDWLESVAGEMSLESVLAVEERLAARRDQVKLVEGDLAEWVALVERAVASSLRTPKEELPETEVRLRGAVLELAASTITRIVRLRGLLGDLSFGVNAAEELLPRAGGWRGWLRTSILKPAAEIVADVDAALGASLFKLGEAPVTTYGLLRVAVILLLGVLLSRSLRHLLERFGQKEAGRPSAALYTVGRLAHYVIVAAALMIGLASIGLDFGRLALVAGALSIGIGFGLQSIVNNFVSGLMILFEQNLKVGDVVELDSGARGVVREINVRSTRLSTPDGIDIVVPNSEFIAAKVTNYTLSEPYHRVHVPFGVAYGSDKEDVRRVVNEAALRVPFTHQRPGREPDVWLVRFGDNSLDFELVVWINPAAVTRPGSVAATYLWEIESALRANGIQIPFPQRDVRLTLGTAEAAALPGLGQRASG